MARYRLYQLQDNRLTGSDEIEACGDAEASRLARARTGPGVVEIWCGDRRVRTVPAAGTLAAC